MLTELLLSFPVSGLLGVLKEYISTKGALLKEKQAFQHALAVSELSQKKVELTYQLQRDMLAVMSMNQGSKWVRNIIVCTMTFGYFSIFWYYMTLFLHYGVQVQDHFTPEIQELADKTYFEICRTLLHLMTSIIGFYMGVSFSSKK